MGSKLELGIGGAEDLDLLSAKACCHAAPVNRMLWQAGIRGGAEFSLAVAACSSGQRCISLFAPRPEPFRCRITALMGSVVAGAGVNPADQRWGFWPLLPL